MNPSSPFPSGIPEACAEFIRPGDDTWRPTPRELRSHITEGLMPSFYTLATNGELTIVECSQTGRIAPIKSANILKNTKAQGLQLPSKKKLTPEEKRLSRIAALKARLEELQNL